MTEDFKKLLALVKTSEAPVECPDCGDWERAEREIGLNFPQDYKTFITTFGTCLIMGVIGLRNPASNAMFPLSKRRLLTREMGDLGYEELKQAASTSLPGEKITFYPEPNGWLYFGNADNAFLFFRNTLQPAEKWRISVTDFEEVQNFDMGFTSFMSEFITNKIELVGLASDSFGLPVYRKYE